MKVLPNISFAILGFISSLVIFSLLFFPPQPVFSQEQCYIFQDEIQRCFDSNGNFIDNCGGICEIGGDGNDPCLSGQYYCRGYRNADKTGSACWTCGSGPSTEKLSCSPPDTVSNNGQTCGGLGYRYVGDDCGDGPGGVQCTGIYTDGCRFCTTPQCPPDTVPYERQCVRNITCSVTNASATGTDSGRADTVINNDGDKTGYTTAEWRLVNTNDNSSQVAGYTNVDQNTGESSNTFSGLQSSTTYRVETTYKASGGGRPDVACSTNNFTTWFPGQTSTQTTCSLSASPQSLSLGGSSTWTLNSSNAPSGSTAWWNGTVSGQISLWTPNSTYTETLFYNNSGSDSRYVDIKNSTGTTLCTTDTIQVYVNPNNCNALQITPSSLNLATGGQGNLTASGIDGSISSWSSDNTSIATVTTFGNPTTVTGNGAGTTKVRVRDSGQGSCISETVSVPITVSTSGTACPGGVSGCGDFY